MKADLVRILRLLPDFLVPIVTLVLIGVTVWRQTGYLTALLFIFFLIFMELRQIRQWMTGLTKKEVP